MLALLRPEDHEKLSGDIIVSLAHRRQQHEGFGIRLKVLLHATLIHQSCYLGRQTGLLHGQSEINFRPHGILLRRHFAESCSGTRYESLVWGLLHKTAANSQYWEFALPF